MKSKSSSNPNLIGQKKLHSLIEVCVNILLGYCIAVTAQIFIFPLFDIHIPLSDHVLIGLFFTVVSVARSYALRRLFNYLHVKGILK